MKTITKFTIVIQLCVPEIISKRFPPSGRDVTSPGCPRPEKHVSNMWKSALNKIKPLAPSAAVMEGAAETLR